MTENVYASNGWDMIAATTQDALNAQLVKISSVPVNASFDVPIFGMSMKSNVDITVGAPQLQVLDGSGRQVNVLFPVTGTVTMGTTKIPLMEQQQLVVTTQLLQVEAELQPHKDNNQTCYDLIIDLKSKALIVDINTSLPAPELAAVITLFKLVVQEHLGDGRQYKVASFMLSDETTVNLKALIPHTADFSFIKNPDNIGRSNMLILMQSISKQKGNIYFNAPLLPEDQDYMVLLSNNIFMNYYVLPPMIDAIKGEAKHPDKVASQISTHSLGNDLYEISNSSDIDLNQDHDPWISSLSAKIDANKKALCFYLNAKADVTFLSIHVDAWDRSWQQFEIDKNDEISLTQVEEEQNSSTSMEWWKWLIAVLLGAIALIITAIIYAIVDANKPNLGGKFKDIGKDLVKWPNQKTVTLKKIESPNHVVIFVDITF